MPQMFWSKVYRVKEHTVIAICDEELLDKKLDFEGFKVHVNKNFYGGNIVDEERAFKLLKDSTMGNIIGKNIVDMAIKKKYIAKENIILIGGVPHAQFIQ